MSEKDKYCMITLLCGVIKKEIIANRLVVAREQGIGEGVVKMGEGSKSTNFQLLNIKYVSHGNIMFSIVTLTILIVNLKVAKRS